MAPLDFSTTSSQEKATFWNGSGYQSAEKHSDGAYWAEIDGNMVKIPPPILHFSTDPYERLYASLDERRANSEKRVAEQEAVKDNAEAKIAWAIGNRSVFKEQYDQACSVLKNATKCLASLFKTRDQDDSDLNVSEKLKANKYRKKIQEQTENKELADAQITDMNFFIIRQNADFQSACTAQLCEYPVLNDINNLEALARHLEQMG